MHSKKEMSLLKQVLIKEAYKILSSTYHANIMRKRRRTAAIVASPQPRLDREILFRRFSATFDRMYTHG